MELSEVTKPYVARGELTAEELDELRVALTRFYVDRGYVTSGAVLPPQTVTDGILTFEIIEGQLTRIEVDNNKWFREGYIRKRLARGAQTPVNIQSLQQRLLLLEQDPRIERLKVELRPDDERSVSHLLHTLYLVHFRAFLHEIDNVQRKVFNRLIDLNVMLSGRGRSDSVVVFLQSSQ